MAFMFENLKVYQKAVDLAELTSSLSESFPRGFYYLTDQLNRAALSVSTNIAEGNGRFTKADRKKYFIIARGSVQECVPILEVCRRRKLISDQQASGLKADLEENSKMISGLINGLENRKV